jgi:hypothetical protein
MAPRILSGLLALSALAAHAAPCAGSVAQLRSLVGDPLFPLAWEETSMVDGRPLLVHLDERAGGLFISFVKTGEGLWAEGAATLCRAGDRLEARFLGERLKIGPAASWLLRRSLESGGAIALEPVSRHELRIGTFGWIGRFVPGSASVGLQPP